MSRRQLHVEKAKFDASQMIDQLGERDFRGIVLAMKHRLGREESADRDPVDAAGESLTRPDLDAVRPAKLVESNVGGHDRRSDPGALRAVGASLHDTRIGTIESDPERASSPYPAQA